MHLLDERLAGMRCTSKQLITVLNSLGGADGRDEVMLVTEELIRKSFSKCGQFVLTSYEKLKIAEGGE